MLNLTNITKYKLFRLQEKYMNVFGNVGTRTYMLLLHQQYPPL